VSSGKILREHSGQAHRSIAATSATGNYHAVGEESRRQRVFPWRPRRPSDVQAAATWPN